VLVINMKTVKDLGMSIPQTILLQAANNDARLLVRTSRLEVRPL
jgi:hypothetical protein